MAMPKLWSETIETHRREVHAAILETTAELVAQRGLLAVTMSEIAERTGIGRATLYKYFSDVESILAAWHELHVEQHLRELVSAREQAVDARDRLVAVLGRYALIQYERRAVHATELAAHLHRSAHARQAKAQRQLRELLRGVLAEAADVASIRRDVAVEEMVAFCLRALAAAADAPSKAAVQRLVRVVVDGLTGPGGENGMT